MAAVLVIYILNKEHTHSQLLEPRFFSIINKNKICEIPVESQALCSWVFIKQLVNHNAYFGNRGDV